MDMILEEPLLRPVFFVGLTVMFAVWETAWPRRQRLYGRLWRWIGNFGILALGSLLARLVLPIVPIGAALWAAQNQVGLFNMVGIPAMVAGTLSFLALDLLIYGQHRLFHMVPMFWRIHRMHHTDLDFDVTTALRFHPIEILLSLIIKSVAVVALGAGPVTVLVFEVVLNGTSLFNHANLALPRWLDRLLRFFVVTPDMHRVHHSIRREETDSNFGFNLPWWDYLMGTYRDQPKDGHDGMTIGLPIFRDKRAINLDQLVIHPFISDSETHQTAPD